MDYAPMMISITSTTKTMTILILNLMLLTLALCFPQLHQPRYGRPSYRPPLAGAAFTPLLKVTALLLQQPLLSTTSTAVVFLLPMLMLMHCVRVSVKFYALNAGEDTPYDSPAAVCIHHHPRCVVFSFHGVLHWADTGAACSAASGPCSLLPVCLTGMQPLQSTVIG